MSRLSARAIVLVTVFIDLMGFSILIPLVNYLVDELGGGILQVGLLISSYSLAQFLFLPVWGRVSDRWGRRPVILFGLGGSAISFIVFGLADPGLGLSSNLTLLMAILFASRFFQGASNANLSAAYAYIADITPPTQRAKGMGQLGAVFGLGFVIGPAIGGLLGQWGIWLAAFVAAGLSGANLLAGLRWLPESLPPEQRRTVKPPLKEALRVTAGYFRLPALGLLLLVFGLFILSFSVIFGIYVEFAKDQLHKQPWEAGLLFAYMGLIGIIVQGKLVERLVARWHEAAVARGGMALMVVGMALIPYTWDIPSMAGATTLFAVGNGLVLPTVNALISRTVGPGEQGAVLGLGQSLGALSRAIGPAAGAMAWTLVGYAAPFRMASLFMAGTLLLAFFIAPPARGEAETPETPTLPI